MSDLCPDAANRLSERLGGFDCDAPLVHLRNPADLTNGTLPVLEAVMVLGAALALGYAVVRRRRHGDSTPLAMALAGVVYLLVVEIPMYFPGRLGLDDFLGTVFVHNVFTVDFLHDRLPLYIVALYVALPLLCYEIVRRTGVFERRGLALGALCVGVVHSAFYEVFDQLGPQLRWWAWNSANEHNQPTMASIPLTSVTLFALVAPAGLVYLVGRLPVRGWVLRALVTGLLVPLTMTVAAIPMSLFGQHAWVLLGEFAVAWAVAVPVLVRCRLDAADFDGPALFLRGFGCLYLASLVGLWWWALPVQQGSVAFAALCFAAALTALLAAWTVPVRVSAPPATTGGTPAGRH